MTGSRPDCIAGVYERRVSLLERRLVAVGRRIDERRRSIAQLHGIADDRSAQLAALNRLAPEGASLDRLIETSIAGEQHCAALRDTRARIAAQADELARLEKVRKRLGRSLLSVRTKADYIRNREASAAKIRAKRAFMRDIGGVCSPRLS